MDKLSYSLGLGIGRQLLQLGAKDLNVDDFAQSIRDILAGKKPAVSDEEAQQIVNNFFREQEEKKATEAKADGEICLKENATKEGVITLPSGLQYKVLREGNGKKPTAADVVECDYEGTLINGQVFDSSYRRGEHATFPLNQVIKGWTEGLQLMKEGAKYRFFIPYNLAYGERGAGQSIPPYAALIFDVELHKVK